MNKYYVNKNAQSNGDHEVHKDGCFFLPSALNREYLGLFNNCREAIAKAKVKYAKANGCFHCCREGHTG